MGLDVGGYEDHTDWPKMGPSLLIASVLILAIRTAKWKATFHEHTAEVELEREIDYAVHLASRVFSTLITRRPSMFPSVKKSWCVPNEDDVPK